MWLTDVSIRRPVFISMFMLALVVLGLRSYLMMPVEELPPIDIPVISVSTVYPAAGPEEVERLITQKIEEQVGTVPNLDYVRSSSTEGLSIVILWFVQGTDMDVAASDVRDRLDRATALLPRDAEKPLLFKVDIAAFPVVTYGVSGRRPLWEVQDLCERIVKPRLSQVPGVASVDITGGPEREIAVRLIPEKLKYYRISPQAVVQTLQAANLNLPAGSVDLGGMGMGVRTVGEFPSVAQIDEVEVPVFANGGSQVGTVRLRDLAVVKDTTAKRTQLARLNGKPSVGISIQRQSGANTIRVVDGVKSAVKELQATLPGDIEFAIANDGSAFVRESVHDVRTHLFAGALLASLVVFLFLRTFRATVIIVLAIPTSLMATFLPIYFAGFTQNTMVLLAMALSVGILVDDAIVVLENIFRHLSLGEEPRQAAYTGRSEIGLAAIAITLTDVVVFIPIAFMGGIVGQFFRQFGITVACATLFSLFVSFTLTPMLASRWFTKREQAAETGERETTQGVSWLLPTYRVALDWALRHRWLTVFVGYAILAVVVSTARQLPQEMLPIVDQGQITVEMDLPPGASLQTTDEAMKEVEKRISALPEAETIFSSVGATVSGFGGGTGTEHAEAFVRFIPRRRWTDAFTAPFHRGPKEKMRRKGQDQLMAEIRQMLSDLPDTKIKASPVESMGGGGPRVEIGVGGTAKQDVLRTAERLQDAMRTMPDLTDVDISYRTGAPEFRVTVDRPLAASMGISVYDVATAARLAIEGVDSTKYREAGREYTIRVLFDAPAQMGLGDVEDMYLVSKDGHPVLIKDVARVSLGSGAVKLERYNQQPTVWLTANTTPDASMPDIRRDIEAAADEIGLPEGISLQFAGEFEIMQESFASIAGALLLSIVLVYVLMAALFESLLYPLVIMTALPMALVGALLALRLTGSSLSIVSQIGMVMLVGLVTKNAILLVDYTNTLRARGRSRDEALREAPPVRLRPVIMTTVTMIMGMTPVAIALGRGSEWRSPMAIAVIGGLILSTVLTLLVIPCMYSIFDDAQAWLLRLFRRRPKES